MFRNISRTLAQLPEKPFRRVLLLSLGATILSMVVLFAVVIWATGLIPQFGWSWVNSTIDWLLGFGAVIGSILLILPVAGLFVGLFLDDVAAAVEARYYAGEAPGRSQPFWPGLWTGLRLALALVALNLVALPLYLLFPVINVVIFLSLNGYLLSREYFELAGHRLLPPGEVRALRRRHRWALMRAGVVVAFVMMIPLVNLIAPLFGTALMVHEFRRLCGDELAKITAR